VREQRVVLEHHAHAAAVRRGPGTPARDLAAVDLDAARVGALEAGQHAQRGGLAAARGAEQGHDLAPLNLQVRPVKRLRGAEALADVP
jgi:hypothetical protein